MKEAVQFLTDKGYDPKHPWVLKFDVEHSINEAQSLVNIGCFAEALVILDILMPPPPVALPSLSTKLSSSIKAPAPAAVSEAVPTLTPSMSAQNAPRASTLPSYFLTPSQQKLVAACKRHALFLHSKALVFQGKFVEADKVITAELANMSSVATALGIPVQDLPLYMDTLVLLAEVKLRVWDVEACKALYVQALTLKTDAFGPDSVDSAEMLVGLAELYRQQGLYTDAETMYTQVKG